MNRFRTLIRIGKDRIRLDWLEEASFTHISTAVRTDWHSHDKLELLICLRGEVRYEFRGHPPAVLTAGNFLVIPARAQHRVSSAVDMPNKRIGLNLRNSSDRSAPYSLFSAADYAHCRTRLERLAFRPVPCPPQMRQCAADLFALAGSPGRRMNSAELARFRTDCCSLLLSFVMSKPAVDLPRKEVMANVVSWVRAHHAENIPVSRLVAHTGYSRARLFTLFKEHTGLAPNEYQQRLRIDSARQLLSSSDLGIRDIAKSCGFTDASYFSRAFRRMTGQTPLAYRRHNPPAAPPTHRQES